MHKDDDAGFLGKVYEESDVWTLWVYTRFGGEVDIDKFGVWLTRSEETKGDCKGIVCVKKKERWLEWDFFVVEIGIGVVRLNAVLKGKEVSLVMRVISDDIWSKAFSGVKFIWRCFEIKKGGHA